MLARLKAYTSLVGSPCRRKLAGLGSGFKNCPGIRRCWVSNDVAARLRERRVLLVERAASDGDPAGAQEPAARVEQRCGDAAEVPVELLALGRHAGAADLAQLGEQLRGARNGVRREIAQPE